MFIGDLLSLMLEIKELFSSSVFQVWTWDLETITVNMSYSSEFWQAQNGWGWKSPRRSAHARPPRAGLCAQKWPRRRTHSLSVQGEPPVLYFVPVAAALTMDTTRSMSWCWGCSCAEVGLCALCCAWELITALWFWGRLHCPALGLHSLPSAVSSGGTPTCLCFTSCSC